MERLSLALLLGCAFIFSGCSPVYDLDGTVSGLLGGSLVLSDGNLNSVEITEDGSFSFAPTKYQAGDAYTVVIESQPAGLDCRVANYNGIITNRSVHNIEVVCALPETKPNPCALDAGNTPGEYQLVDTQIALGSGLGATGFSLFDGDDDGYREFLFGSGTGFGSNRKFAIYEFDAAADSYLPLCEYSYANQAIEHIIAFENLQFNAASLIALSNGQIEIINHRAGIRIASFDSGVNSVEDVAVADVDNDGEAEIAILSADSLVLFNANTFAYEQTLAYGDSAMALGYFSSIDHLQIALNSGYVLQLMSSELSVVWDYSTIGFSNMHLKAGDVDNDGLDEIVAADGWYNLHVFNAELGGILWEAFPDLDVDALQVMDVTGDGVPEVLYGDGQWGASYALDGATGQLLWSVDNPEHGVTDLLVADLDQDNQLELLWGAGYSSTGPDYLFIHDLVTDTLDWQSGESGGPYYAVAFGDIDGDGIQDRIFSSFESESGYGDGIVTVIASSSNQVLWQTNGNTFGGHAWTGIHALAVQDVNADGINDVVVATDNLYDGSLYFLSGADGSVMDEITLDSGSPLYSLALADVDGDGVDEILAGGGKEHTGSIGTFVYQLDGSTSTLEFTYPSMGTDWADVWSLETLDMDADGDLEIIAAKGGVYTIDPVNNALARTAGTSYTSIAVSSSQAFVGDSSGTISTLAMGGETDVVADVCEQQIDALEAVSDSKLAFTCGGRLGIYDLAGMSVEWQTLEPIDAMLGRYDTLEHGVVEGRSALLVGGSTVYYFMK